MIFYETGTFDHLYILTVRVRVERKYRADVPVTNTQVSIFNSHVTFDRREGFQEGYWFLLPDGDGSGQQFGRIHIIGFLKAFGKIGQVIEPHLVSNFRNRAFSLFQILIGFFQADFPDKFGGRATDNGF